MPEPSSGGIGAWTEPAVSAWARFHVPELPDVEGARREVERHAVGAVVRDVVGPDGSVLRETTLPRLRRRMRRHCLRSVRRHGKWLILGTDVPIVVIHFGMTGQLRWVPLGTETERFQRISFVTDRGELRFVDRRKLGGIWLADSELDLRTLLDGLGPDALGLPCTELERILTATRQRLKSVLMDQSVVAGLGNMLSDEILWRARLHPLRASSTLTSGERRRLCTAMSSALTRSVRAGHIPRSPTWLSSQRAEDNPVCPRCAGELRWSRINGRSSLWCPHCQPP